MNRKIYWIFILFCGIIMVEMTGCSNKIEILTLETNPSEFSPDGDGVNDNRGTMIEAGITTILNEGEINGNNKVKGIIISDSFAKSPMYLDWQFPTKRKPSDEYLGLIGK